MGVMLFFVMIDHVWKEKQTYFCLHIPCVCTNFAKI